MDAVAVSIAPGQPGADERLLRAVARLFAEGGAAVRVAPAAENLVRRCRPGEASRSGFVVEAQGLPNLLHEALHWLQAGVLDEDYGIDYALIPFDTGDPAQRRLLWQELACCVVSCAYLPGDPARVDPWFAEQVGIQHHFYGYDASAPFLGHVERLVARHGDELEAVVARAYAGLAAALRGVAPELADPPRQLSFGVLWARMRA